MRRWQQHCHPYCRGCFEEWHQHWLWQRWCMMASLAPELTCGTALASFVVILMALFILVLLCGGISASLVPVLTTSDVLVLIPGGTLDSFVTALMVLFPESASLLAELMASIMPRCISLTTLMVVFFFVDAVVAAPLFPSALLILTHCFGSMDVLVVRVAWRTYDLILCLLKNDMVHGSIFLLTWEFHRIQNG